MNDAASSLISLWPSRSISSHLSHSTIIMAIINNNYDIFDIQGPHDKLDVWYDCTARHSEIVCREDDIQVNVAKEDPNMSFIALLRALCTGLRKFKALSFVICGCVSVEEKDLCKLLASSPFQKLNIFVTYSCSRRAHPDYSAWFASLPHGRPHPWLRNLKANSSLTHLSLENLGMDESGASALASVLETNQTLLHLNVHGNKIDSVGTASIARALTKNHTLVHLDMSANPMDYDGVKSLAGILSFQSEDQDRNTSLRHLRLGGSNSKMGSEGASALAHMICTNTTLTHLEILNEISFLSSDVVGLFRALKSSACLTSFALLGCGGVSGSEVQAAILDAVRVNFCLKALGLYGTDLGGLFERRIQNLLQRINENQCRALLKLPKVKSTAARVFFCGYAYAGKTTLRRTMVGVLKKEKFQLPKSISKVLKPETRTTGIEVNAVECQGMRLSFWDLAGQQEYRAFHDLMFPTDQGASLFLIVCNPIIRTPIGALLKKEVDRRKELEYWLRYISSNTRKTDQWIPHVLLVFTHHDKVPERADLSSWAEVCVGELRREFEGFVKVDPNVFLVDGWNQGSVEEVAGYVCQTAREILRSSPQVYRVCDEVRRVFVECMVKQPYRPLMRGNEFVRLCQTKIPELKLESEDHSEEMNNRRRAVLYSLHDSGDVIYFEDLQLIIVNPEWFCRSFLGRIVDLTAESCKQLDCLDDQQGQGIRRRKQIEKILEESWNDHYILKGFSRRRRSGDLSIKDLVRVMLQLELCYEVDPTNGDSGLFIPATLVCNSYGDRKWQSEQNGECIYMGRRLKCDDEKHTFLTPGFFPRIQVYLHKVFQGPNRRCLACYTVEKDLIKIDQDGFEILVEFSGEHGYFIDILARSSQSHEQTLKFIRDNVINAIEELHLSSVHWQGVSLVEGIIRPSCVKNLTPCKDRQDQFVLVEDLKKILLNGSAAKMDRRKFTWPGSQTESGLPVEHVSIKELLGEEEFREVLGTHSRHIEQLGEELQIGASSSSTSWRESRRQDSMVERKRGRTLSDFTGRDPLLVNMHHRVSQIEGKMEEVNGNVEEIKMDVKEMKMDVKEIKHAVEELAKHEKGLQPEVERVFQRLLLNSSQISSKVPRIFLLTHKEHANSGTKLLTRLVPGLKYVKLQFMCECSREEPPHVVEGQQGCELKVLENESLRRIYPYLRHFLCTLTLALKVGAHVVGGMGGLIPDVSKAVHDLVQGAALGLDTPGLPPGPDGSPAVAEFPASGMIDASSSSAAKMMMGGDDVKLAIARGWVEEVLRKEGCVEAGPIWKRFKLLKVRYVADGHIAWLCEKHARKGLKSGSIKAFEEQF